MGKDYYRLLGVDKSVNEKDLKKAYKKLAMKYHPDRNKDNKEEAEAKFKEISKAYEALSNPEKRRLYDQFGEDGLQGQMPSNFNPHDIFNDIFGGNSPFGGMGGFFGGNRRNRQPEKNIMQYNIDLTLEEVFNGCEKIVEMDINIKCDTCNAKGCKDPSKSFECETCKGTGQIHKTQQIGPFQIAQQVLTCNKCKGEGETVIPKILRCSKCNGMKVINKRKKFKVPVMPGVLDGYQMTNENSGNYNVKSGLNDDIHFIFHIKNNTSFKREGINLIFYKDISLGSALCGINFAIKHINGELINIEYSEIIKPEDSLTCIGYGLPDIDNKGKFGNLIIRFNIRYPSSIKEEYKNYLYRMLYVDINQNSCLEANQIPKDKVKKIDVFKEMKSWSSKKNNKKQEQHNEQQPECHVQ
jgi:chaperone protein DnaJ